MGKSTKKNIEELDEIMEEAILETRRKQGEPVTMLNPNGFVRTDMENVFRRIEQIEQRLDDIEERDRTPEMQKNENK